MEFPSKESIMVPPKGYTWRRCMQHLYNTSPPDDYSGRFIINPHLEIYESNRNFYGIKKNRSAELFTSILQMWSIADSNRSPRHCQCRALAR